MDRCQSRASWRQAARTRHTNLSGASARDVCERNDNSGDYQRIPQSFPSSYQGRIGRTCEGTRLSTPDPLKSRFAFHALISTSHLRDPFQIADLLCLNRLYLFRRNANASPLPNVVDDRIERRNHKQRQHGRN